jgi:L-fuconolactonase
LVKAFPKQKFVVNHLAKPNIKTKQIDDWKKQMLALAQYDNVWCKLSGMVTEADWRQWKQDDFSPYLDVMVEAFGTKRIMYGSDWPVCLVAASYGQVLGIVQAYFASCSVNEQQDIFGHNAAGFYNL